MFMFIHFAQHKNHRYHYSNRIHSFSVMLKLPSLLRHFHIRSPSSSLPHLNHITCQTLSFAGCALTLWLLFNISSCKHDDCHQPMHVARTYDYSDWRQLYPPSTRDLVLVTVNGARELQPRVLISKAARSRFHDSHSFCMTRASKNCCNNDLKLPYRVEV
jgi:hypothetical protein